MVNFNKNELQILMNVKMKQSINSLGSEDMAELLIKRGANGNIMNKEGQTVLNWAAARGNRRID